MDTSDPGWNSVYRVRIKANVVNAGVVDSKVPAYLSKRSFAARSALHAIESLAKCWDLTVKKCVTRLNQPTRAPRALVYICTSLLFVPTADYNHTTRHKSLRPVNLGRSARSDVYIVNKSFRSNPRQRRQQQTVKCVCKLGYRTLFQIDNKLLQR